MLCKAFSIGKARQLAMNKHVDDSKKATRAGESIFSDLATIKVPHDNGIHIPYRKGHLEFYSTKSDFVELMFKKFSKWKNNGKPVS